MRCYEVRKEFDIYSLTGLHTFVEGEILSLKECQRLSKKYDWPLEKVLKAMNDLGELKSGDTYMFFGVRHLSRRGKRKLGRED